MVVVPRCVPSSGDPYVNFPFSRELGMFRRETRCFGAILKVPSARVYHDSMSSFPPVAVVSFHYLVSRDDKYLEVNCDEPSLYSPTGLNTTVQLGFLLKGDEQHHFLKLDGRFMPTRGFGTCLFKRRLGLWGGGSKGVPLFTESLRHQSGRQCRYCHASHLKFWFFHAYLSFS
ncbi:hypothetical protein LZ30DRAFT_434402 [Colletotrichum cereale]|nr:hypothetical protein LZ30DRAFT_434402 [Colletotrichum cereale]